MSVGRLSRKQGMSRQNYYKARLNRRWREVDSGPIERLVQAEWAIQPRLGGRKVFHQPGPKLAEAGVRIGRDRFLRFRGKNR
jgi:hypothetical protein